MLRVSNGGEALMAFVFAANDGLNGFELWTSDGTAGGTKLLKNISAGGGSSLGFSFDMLALGSNVVFAANDGVHGSELWISDGSTAGTKLLKDINLGTADSQPFLTGFPAVLNNKLLFQADDGTHGFEMW